jgi:hypothetical protein
LVDILVGSDYYRERVYITHIAMLPERKIDLSIAFETFHKLGLEDGDLGYAYWYQVRKLLEEAEQLVEENARLKAELERCQLAHKNAARSK